MTSAWWRSRLAYGGAVRERATRSRSWSGSIRIGARGCSAGVGGLDRVALVAGQHHERRDGSGYPFGLAGDLGRVSGLLACVVLFDERTAIGDRREGVDVAAEMAALADAGALDQRDVQAVLEAVGLDAPRSGSFGRRA